MTETPGPRPTVTLTAPEDTPSTEVSWEESPKQYDLLENPSGGVDWLCDKCPSSGTKETWHSAESYAEFHISTIHPSKENQK